MKLENFASSPLPDLDLGPRNGSEYGLICPTSTPFLAQIVAKVPELDHARAIRDRCNAYPKLVAMLMRAALDENYEADDCVSLLRELGELRDGDSHS